MTCVYPTPINCFTVSSQRALWCIIHQFGRPYLTLRILQRQTHILWNTVDNLLLKLAWCCALFEPCVRLCLLLCMNFLPRVVNAFCLKRQPIATYVSTSWSATKHSPLQWMLSLIQFVCLINFCNCVFWFLKHPKVPTKPVSPYLRKQPKIFIASPFFT